MRANALAQIQEDVVRIAKQALASVDLAAITEVTVPYVTAF